MDEATKIKKLKEKGRFRPWQWLGLIVVIVLFLLYVVFWPQVSQEEPKPQTVVVTATPTAVVTPVSAYQPSLPSGPVQTVIFDADPALVGRVGYAVYSGNEWQHTPYCTAVNTCSWLMQPPNDTFHIWLEYNGREIYKQADPLDPALLVPVFVTVEEVLP
jgi:hypothetical protein